MRWLIIDEEHRETIAQFEYESDRDTCLYALEDEGDYGRGMLFATESEDSDGP